MLGGMALPDGALVRKEKDGWLPVMKLKRGVCAGCITVYVTPCLHDLVRVFLPCFCLESPYSFRKETRVADNYTQAQVGGVKSSVSVQYYHQVLPC